MVILSRIACAVALFCCTLPAFAQGVIVASDLFQMAQRGQFQVFNREASAFEDGQYKGLRMSERGNDGVAWIHDITFGNGTIDLDIRGRDVLQKSFVGVAFHGVDNKTYDAVYFRPFNFQATDSVRRIHAVQYISHPDFTWKRLREERNGQYEKAIAPAPRASEWFHVSIVVQHPKVQVFVNGKAEPALRVEQLSKRGTGKIGLWVGDQSNGDFANLKITQ
jgi:hypothetical protein